MLTVDTRLCDTPLCVASVFFFAFVFLCLFSLLQHRRRHHHYQHHHRLKAIKCFFLLLDHRIKLCHLLLWNLFAEFIDFRLNGAIMLKQMIIAIVLMSLLVGNQWNTEAGSRRPPRSHNVQASESKAREKRFVNPFPKLFSIWNALTHIYSLYVEVSPSVCAMHTHIIFAKCTFNVMHFPRDVRFFLFNIFLLLFVLISAKKRNAICAWGNLWCRSRWFQRYVHVDDTANGTLQLS